MTGEEYSDPLTEAIRLALVDYQTSGLEPLAPYLAAKLRDAGWGDCCTNCGDTDTPNVICERCSECTECSNTARLCEDCSGSSCECGDTAYYCSDCAPARSCEECGWNDAELCTSCGNSRYCEECGDEQATKCDDCSNASPEPRCDAFACNQPIYLKYCATHFVEATGCTKCKKLIQSSQRICDACRVPPEVAAVPQAQPQQAMAAQTVVSDDGTITVTDSDGNTIRFSL